MSELDRIRKTRALLRALRFRRSAEVETFSVSQQNIYLSPETPKLTIVATEIFSSSTLLPNNYSMLLVAKPSDQQRLTWATEPDRQSKLLSIFRRPASSAANEGMPLKWLEISISARQIFLTILDHEFARHPSPFISQTLNWTSPENEIALSFTKYGSQVNLYLQCNFETAFSIPFGGEVTPSVEGMRIQLGGPDADGEVLLPINGFKVGGMGVAGYSVIKIHSQGVVEQLEISSDPFAARKQCDSFPSALVGVV